MASATAAYLLRAKTSTDAADNRMITMNESSAAAPDRGGIGELPVWIVMNEYNETRVIKLSSNPMNSDSLFFEIIDQPGVTPNTEDQRRQGEAGFSRKQKA